ncbi:MAG: tRNA1(Val) (adenine(37)-N6)-methyltransferase [Erysipelotrichales bacterium]|nr:tRNA1(Val) (adenine(37)-N6)-methyltransferase [Erysipelotrichales bacterium]
MKEVINDLMGYEGLKIIQNPEMFNFSLDSMLLAAFATVNNKTKRIIDLCTGNAPIPLYLTLRTKYPIIGIEIQKEVFDLAERSIKLNNLESQITVINADVKNIHQKIGKQSFDLVLCNPPFFPVTEKSNLNKNDYLTIARHEVKCNLEDIISEAFKLLNNSGYLALIHRPERLSEIIALFEKYHLAVKKIRFVYPRRQQNANHILIEGIKNGRPGGCKVLAPLYVYNKNKWTKEVLNIYNYKMEE